MNLNTKLILEWMPCLYIFLDLLYSMHDIYIITFICEYWLYFVYIDKYIWTIYWYVYYTYIDMYYIYIHWYVSFPPSLSLFISLFIQFPSFPCTWIISDFGRLSFQLTKLEQASWWVQRWVLHSKQSIFRSMALALMVTTARASCCWWFLDDFCCLSAVQTCLENVGPAPRFAFRIS